MLFDKSSHLVLWAFETKFANLKVLYSRHHSEPVDAPIDTRISDQNKSSYTSPIHSYSSPLPPPDGTNGFHSANRAVTVVTVRDAGSTFNLEAEDEVERAS